MTLPEPARQAWHRHREALVTIAVREAPSGRLLLGGGTALAARWKHRVSVDIDVLVPDRNGLQDAHPGGPTDLARATGGEVVSKARDRIKVQVGETLLDVTAITPQLPGLEVNEEIEGHNQIVLSSAQILRGKLNRTHHGLARDAFDLISAARADRQALQTAVNALDRTETEVVCQNLRGANSHMANDAPNALRGIADEFRTDLNQLGEQSAAAVEDSRYMRVRITLAAGHLIIERETRNESKPPAQYAIQNVADALQQTGIDGYLTANHATHAGIATLGIAKLHSQGQRGLVFDTAQDQPAAEIQRAAAAAFEDEERQLHPNEVRPGRPNDPEQERRGQKKPSVELGQDAPEPPRAPEPAAGLAASKSRSRGHSKSDWHSR